MKTCALNKGDEGVQGLHTSDSDQVQSVEGEREKQRRREQGRDVTTEMKEGRRKGGGWEGMVGGADDRAGNVKAGRKDKGRIENRGKPQVLIQR